MSGRLMLKSLNGVRGVSLRLKVKVACPDVTCAASNYNLVAYLGKVVFQLRNCHILALVEQPSPSCRNLFRGEDFVKSHIILFLILIDKSRVSFAPLWFRFLFYIFHFPVPFSHCTVLHNATLHLSTFCLVAFARSVVTFPSPLESPTMGISGLPVKLPCC